LSKILKVDVSSRRIDPYKNYSIRLKWKVGDKWRTVLGASKVSGLKRTTEVVKQRSGGENNRDHKTPTRTSYEGITLEQAITTDTEFEKWINTVYPLEDIEKNLAHSRRNLRLEVWNEQQKLVLRYRLYGCWVSKYDIPEIDANANAIAIESIKIETEGWDRGMELVEEIG